MRGLPILAALCGTALAGDQDFINKGLKNFDKIVQEQLPYKNHVYSPMAIRVMATALMRGTSGEALKELADAFGFELGDDLAKPNEAGYLEYMKKTFEREKPNLQQSIAWSSEKYYNLNADYRDVVREDCGIQLKRMKTFVGKENYLNKVISNGTGGAIEDFFQPGSMTADVKMMMLNSLKFEEKWNKNFQMKTNGKKKFYDLDQNPLGEFETFTRGNLSQKIKYWKDEKTWVEYIWLPFRAHNKKQPYMVFALPDYANVTHVKDDADFKSSDLFRDVDFKKARNAVKTNKAILQKVNFSIPKFKFDTNLPLTEILKSLGVKSIFDASKSPFKRLFQNAKGMSLSDAVHKSMIEVNEVGAKAAAATAFQLESRSEPKKVHLDHPFKFFITNRRMSNVYFTGIVYKP